MGQTCMARDKQEMVADGEDKTTKLAHTRRETSPAHQRFEQVMFEFPQLTPHSVLLPHCLLHFLRPLWRKVAHVHHKIPLVQRTRLLLSCVCVCVCVCVCMRVCSSTEFTGIGCCHWVRESEWVRERE